MTSKAILTIVLTLVETKAKVKPIYVWITDPGITPLDVKGRLVRLFKKKQRPQITDFKVHCQENSKDTIPIDIFERQYENENLLELLQKLHITNPTTKYVKIQFSVIQREFRALFLNKKKESQLISVPLSFQADVSFIKDQFKENDFVKDNLTPQLHDFRFYIQIQGKTYDLEKFLQSSLNFDINAFFSNHKAAFVFLYPNTVHISYHSQTSSIECGDKNETVQSVIERSLQSFGKTDLSPDNFSLIYNGKEITQEHIHDFLISLTQNARLCLLQKADLDFFFVYLKFGKKKIGFRFPRSLKNFTLQKLFEQYFNIKDPQMKLERRYNKEETIPITTKISDKTILPGKEFCLRTTEPITHITRQFQIDNEIKSIEIPLNSRIENLHQLIQQAFNTGSSIESISISNGPLQNEQFISQLYIPPEENFIVKLRANPTKRFIIIKHDNLEIESVDVELDVESQVSIIKQLGNLPETTILYFHRKIQLKDNDKIKDVVQSYPKERVIDAYISNLYCFEYEETKRPLELTGRISNNLKEIKSRFIKHGLPQDKEIFLTDENGISFIPNDKNIDEYPNGTTFKVKLVLKLPLNIRFDQKQYPIEIENTKSGQDLIHQLSTITRHEEETLRIYSPLQKVIEPDHFLFEYFTDPNKTYKISAIPLKEFPFINESGKMFYVYLSPTDTISYVKELIKKPKTKTVIKISPDDKLYLVYNGQLLDDTKPISSILEQNSDHLEEDTDPLDFDEPINVYVNDIALIQVTWTVVTTSQSSSSNSIPTVNKVIKGTKIGTIQNIISKASSLHYDSIVLVSNGEELPSEFELHENITLTVSIRQDESANPIDLAKTMSQTQRILEKNATTAEQKVANNDDDDGYEYEDENNDIDEDKLLEQAHGVITRSDNDDEYVYKFKYIDGEEFKLQLPKDVSVIQAIEAIVNMRNNEGNITQPEDVTISMSSTRLSNFHIFAALTIPQTVNYFSVKVVSINQSLIFTRNGLKS